MRILATLMSGYFLFWYIKYVCYLIINFVHPQMLLKKGRHTNIHPTVLLRHAQNIEIRDYCLINHGNVLQAGKQNAKIIIGSKVHTGPNVMFFAYNHAYDDTSIPTIDQGYTENGITIGDDVWIGAGAIILDGVTLGPGCIVGAGSVVNQSFAENSIVGGIPAKLITTRKSFA